jgi:hypothetical protein
LLSLIRKKIFELDVLQIGTILNGVSSITDMSEVESDLAIITVIYKSFNLFVMALTSTNMTHI